MEKIRFLLLLLLSSSMVSAQEAEFDLKSLLKATATISPGISLTNSAINIYLNGDLEYFTESRISFRGDVYWYTGSQQDTGLFKQNSSLYAGALYHFPKKRFDCFVGLQPGISLTELEKRPATFGSDQLTKICGNFSVLTGLTYYVGNYFNFFFNVRYVKGMYYGEFSQSLDELRLSAGLGFNIFTKKRK